MLRGFLRLPIPWVERSVKSRVVLPCQGPTLRAINVHVLRLSMQRSILMVVSYSSLLVFGCGSAVDTNNSGGGGSQTTSTTTQGGGGATTTGTTASNTGGIGNEGGGGNTGGAGGEGGTGGGSTTSSTSSTTSSTGCVPIVEDGSKIGVACANGTGCPTGYTCHGFSGFVFQELCAVLCEQDCECPSGTQCKTVSDKGSTWTECQP